MQDILKRPFLGILLCWFFALLIQLPNTFRPLSKHHEFNTAMVLNVTQSWLHNGGAATFNCTPLIYFGNDGDTYFGNDSLLTNGKYYYPSFGPFQFLLVYGTAKIVGIEPSPLLVKSIGALLLLLVLTLVFKILQLLLKGNTKQSLLGTILFATTPAILWYFTNGYVHESVAMPCYLYLFYYTLLLTGKAMQLSLKHHCVLVVALLIGVTTDWFVLFATGVAVVTLLIISLQKKEFKKYSYSILIMLLSSIVALLTVIYCYSTEMGWQAFINNLTYKFFVRSGNVEFSSGVLKVLQHWITLTGVLLFIVLLYIILTIQSFFKYKYNKRNAWVIRILFIVPLAYSLIFKNYTILHEYASLKFVLPIFLLIFLFICNAKLHSYLLYLGTVMLVNILIYYKINPPATNSTLVKIYNDEKSIGLSIKNRVSKDVYIFSDLINTNNLAIMYYAQRNVRYFYNSNEAQLHVTKYNITPAVFVTKSGDSTVITKMNP